MLTSLVEINIQWYFYIFSNNGSVYEERILKVSFKSQFFYSNLN